MELSKKEKKNVDSAIALRTIPLFRKNLIVNQAPKKSTKYNMPASELITKSRELLIGNTA